MTNKILISRELLEEAADVLAMFNKKLQPQVNGADESCFTIGLKQQVTFGQMVAAAQAHDNLRAALDAPSVPEGWQLVPKEPTQEMMAAHDNLLMQGVPRGRNLIYKAMLLAAPKAPTTDDRKDAERYRWLRHGDNDEPVLRSHFSSHDGETSFWLLRGEELDAAIDAAMAAQKGTKE